MPGWMKRQDEPHVHCPLLKKRQIGRGAEDLRPDPAPLLPPVPSGSSPSSRSSSGADNSVPLTSDTSPSSSASPSSSLSPFALVSLLSGALSKSEVLLGDSGGASSSKSSSPSRGSIERLLRHFCAMGTAECAPRASLLMSLLKCGCGVGSGLCTAPSSSLSTTPSLQPPGEWLGAAASGSSSSAASSLVLSATASTSSGALSGSSGESGPAKLPAVEPSSSLPSLLSTAGSWCSSFEAMLCPFLDSSHPRYNHTISLSPAVTLHPDQKPECLSCTARRSPPPLWRLSSICELLCTFVFLNGKFARQTHVWLLAESDPGLAGSEPRTYGRTSPLLGLTCWQVERAGCSMFTKTRN